MTSQTHPYDYQGRRDRKRQSSTTKEKTLLNVQSLERNKQILMEISVANQLKKFQKSSLIKEQTPQYPPTPKYQSQIDQPYKVEQTQNESSNKVQRKKWTDDKENKLMDNLSTVKRPYTSEIIQSTKRTLDYNYPSQIFSDHPQSLNSYNESFEEPKPYPTKQGILNWMGLTTTSASFILVYLVVFFLYVTRV